MQHRTFPLLLGTLFFALVRHEHTQRCRVLPRSKKVISLAMLSPNQGYSPWCTISTERDISPQSLRECAFPCAPTVKRECGSLCLVQQRQSQKMRISNERTPLKLAALRMGDIFGTTRYFTFRGYTANTLEKTVASQSIGALYR